MVRPCQALAGFSVNELISLSLSVVLRSVGVTFLVGPLIQGGALIEGMRRSPHQLISGRDCARTKVPHASLRGQRGSKEDGTHLLDGVLQPCAQTVTHPPWIGMFLLSVFRIPSVLLSVQNSA